ncbi:hypothetical protein FHU10_3670 [Serratia fonticola]|uniref:Uncharacterized protein n=1 Tax=Serratia fonticola TaxID=47917 RepID=A0A542BS52_SERFO|nr:hypothetical protein [Serratia fonticola]TQI81410.1 hypothetical protein FHU09_4036 [Serratia fonticola]TQI96566.1 hypothetical protein FHU11_2009 [Serratia fonticola]TVZ71063.1 hypothetical protein FHU10_3670 [Serratia fonticola]
MTNYIENYSRIKTESDHTLALTLDNSVRAIGEIAEDTFNTIGEGVKRLTWRTSYFFDGYQDVNQQINTEDYRFLLAMKQVVKNKNIIFLMIEVYIRLLLKDSDDKKIERIARKTLRLSSTISSIQLTQKAIIFAIQQQIVITLFKNEVARKRIAATSNITLTILKLYGYIEEAAISANGLKRESPDYYRALYSLEIEMLYFIIKPILNHVVSAIGKKLSENEIVEILNKLFNGN